MVLLRSQENHTFCTPTASHVLAVGLCRESEVQKILKKGGISR